METLSLNHAQSIKQSLSPCWRPHMFKIPWRRFIHNRRRTYASLHGIVQLNQLRLSNCIINVIVWISSTSSASLFNAFCVPFMLPRAALPRRYVATPRHSSSGGQGRFTTRSYLISWTGAIIWIGRRTFRRPEIRRGATDGGGRFYIVTPALQMHHGKSKGGGFYSLFQKFRGKISLL